MTRDELATFLALVKARLPETVPGMAVAHALEMRRWPSPYPDDERLWSTAAAALTETGFYKTTTPADADAALDRAIIVAEAPHE